ncbi:MAG: zf-HC2 domain-containing protein [Planctomycetes bacterium]|nr:zf-HC2 domain-containing protein [Planctomycetota bacterium]
MAETLLPDIRLVAACLAGDRTAFTALLARHQGGVTEYAFSLTGDLGRAEDVARDALREAFRNLHRLRQNSSFGNWAIALARTAWRARREEERAAAARAGTPPPRAPEGEDLPCGLDRERVRSIGQALASIPKSFRETVVLRHMNRLSCVEIARIRSDPPGAVAQRLCRAHGMLRALAGGPFLPGERAEGLPGVPGCGRKRERLSLLVTGDVEPGERASLEQHVEACEACRCDLVRTRRFLGEMDAYLGAFAGRAPLLPSPPAERWGLGLAAGIAIFAIAAFLLWQAFTPSGILAGQPRAIPFDLQVTASTEGHALVRDLRLLLGLRPGPNDIILRQVARAIEPGSARAAVDGDPVPIEEEPHGRAFRIRVEGGSASHREADLTYILPGLCWRPEYEIAIREDGALDIAGWALVRNDTGFTRESARLRLLAPLGEESDRAAARKALLRVAGPLAGPPVGFDLRAFASPVRLRPGVMRLPLARARGLPFARVMVLDLTRPVPLRTVARIRAQDAVGLDLPVPRGDVRILGGAYPPLSFEGGLDPAPDGEGLEIPIGGAPGVDFELEAPPEGESAGGGIAVRNAREHAIEIEVRIPVSEGRTVRKGPRDSRVERGSLRFPLRIEGGGTARAAWLLDGP